MTSTPLRRQLTVVLLATLAVLAGCGGAMNDGSGASAQQATAGGDAAYDAGSGGGGSGGGGGVGSYYADSGDRVVVREASMRLQVGNFSRAFHRLRAVARRNGGYLGDRSQDSQGEWDTGTITVRVPPEQFASTRDAIASLGQVESEDVRVLDFTNQYADRQSRIEDLEREERALERLLNRTDSVEDAERVREDLRQVRSRIRDLRNQQESVRQRERLSTIRVDMHEPTSRQPPKNYATAFGFQDAFLEAFYGGLSVVKYVIVLFGYAVPVGVSLIALGAFGLGLLAASRRVHRTLASVLGWGAGTSSLSGGAADEGGDDAGSQLGGVLEAGADETEADEDAESGADASDRPD